MNDEQAEPMKYIGWLGDTQYAIKEKSGKSDSGREWEMTSVSLRINFSTFKKAIGAQVKRLTSKQQVTIMGIPKITQKGDKTYMNIEIVSIEGDLTLAPPPDLAADPLKQPPQQQSFPMEQPPDAPITEAPEAPDDLDDSFL